MRNFYSRPRRAQWAVALVLGLVALLPGAAMVAGLEWAFRMTGPAPAAKLAGAVGCYLLWVALLPVWMPLLQFATSPLMYLLGRYRYLSPMLLVENPSATEYRLHGGTNFDYWVHLRWRDRGAPAARRTLALYLRGLLALADEVQSGRLSPELRIVGTSYIFTARTAERLGFTVEPAAPGHVLGLYANYLNLFWKNSFARGRLARPELGRIQQAATTGARLVRSRPKIEALLARVGGEEG